MIPQKWRGVVGCGQVRLGGVRRGKVWYGEVRKISNQFQRNKRELLKEQCLRYLGGKICAICGDISEFVCCYEFHHKKGAKGEEISKMIARKTKLDAELKGELDKCSVVCITCHRKITNKVMPLESLKLLYCTDKFWEE